MRPSLVPVGVLAAASASWSTPAQASPGGTRLAPPADAGRELGDQQQLRLAEQRLREAAGHLQRAAQGGPDPWAVDGAQQQTLQALRDVRRALEQEAASRAPSERARPGRDDRGDPPLTVGAAPLDAGG
jgi:hypothetical protein